MGGVKEMKAMSVMMSMAAGAALGAVAGYAARDMGTPSPRQIKSQAKRAVKAMENMTDRLS